MFYCSPETITLSELASLLNLKDNRAAKKWLKEKNIFLHTRGKEKYIYKWHFDFAQQLMIVEDLKRQNPATWFKFYQKDKSRPELTEAVFEVHPPMSIVKNRISTKHLKTFIS
jgi:hypothetical protein